MGYIATEYVKLPTELGTLVLWCNGTREDGALSIGVRTEAEHNRSDRNAPAGGWEGVAESVTVNRVEYHLHAFLRASRDTGEVYGGDGWGEYGSRGSILRRAEMFSLGNGSQSAEILAWDVVSRAVSAYLITDEARAMVRRAVFAQASNERDELDRKAEDLLKQLEEVRKAIKAQSRKMASNAPQE